MSIAEKWLLDSTSTTNALDSNTNGSENNAPDFLTQQSLASFPIATAIVTALWKVLKDFLFDGESWAGSSLVPLALAATIILAGLAFTWTDLQGPTKRLAACLIGALNTLLLTGAALGIEYQVF